MAKTETNNENQKTNSGKSSGKKSFSGSRRKSVESMKQVAKAKVYITATFNNTLATFTDMKGNTICWGSAGATGFKGARKSTPYAATMTVENASKRALQAGVKEVEVYVKGPGIGRDAALRSLRAAGFRMSLIADVTPIPHNGPRPRKRRRV
jgi:small subunit ribosomal protein S11